MKTVQKKTILDSSTGKEVVSVRIYQCEILLAEKGLPIIFNTSSELQNWLYLHEQTKLHANITRDSKLGVMVDGSNEDSPATREDHPVVAEITNLSGVQYAVAVGYQLIVIKGGRFSWDDIEPNILLILQATQSSSLDDLEIMFKEEEAHSEEK